MKENTAQIIMIGVMLLITFSGFITLMKWVDFDSTQRECIRYEGYGYVTEFKSNFWDGYDCLIVMKDGTRIQSYDYDISHEREPLMGG